MLRDGSIGNGDEASWANADATPRWKIVHGELVGNARRRAALDADEARWLREAETLQIWRPFGMVSMLDYLERVLGYAPRTGQHRLRVARALGDLPELTEALTSGELPFSAVKELVRVATPRTEASWRHAARDKSVREIEQLVSGHKPGDLPGDPPDPEAQLHTVVFEEVCASAFVMMRQARQVLDTEHGTRMSDSDVVVALASAVLDGAASGASNGRAKSQISYTLCFSCERGWQEGGGVQVPVDAETIDQAQCDAQHLGRIDGGAPARATQDIPPSVVRFVELRDGHACTTPGCRSSRGLEIHHIVPRSRGGTHDPSNLTLRCGSCHRAHHLGLLTISGAAPDHLVTTRAHDPRRAHVDALGGDDRNRAHVDALAGDRDRRGAHVDALAGDRDRRGAHVDALAGDRDRRGASVDALTSNGARHCGSVDALTSNGARHRAHVDALAGDRDRRGAHVDALAGDRDRRGAHVDALAGDRDRRGASVDALAGDRDRRGAHVDALAGDRDRRGAHVDALAGDGAGRAAHANAKTFPLEATPTAPPLSAKWQAVAVRTEAISGLKGMGWPLAIATRAVDAAIQAVGVLPVAELIFAALRRCPRPTSS